MTTSPRSVAIATTPASVSMVIYPEFLACSFNPTDAKFVTASDDGTVRVWDFLRCREEHILRGHGSDVKQVCSSASHLKAPSNSMHYVLTPRAFSPLAGRLAPSEVPHRLRQQRPPHPCQVVGPEGWPEPCYNVRSCVSGVVRISLRALLYKRTLKMLRFADEHCKQAGAR